MTCWHCNAPLPRPSWGKLSFRASCDKCSSDLHCCKNCKFYKPGMSNDCMIPETEWVRDREKNNLCEEFAPLEKREQPPSNNAKKRFEDLFT